MKMFNIYWHIYLLVIYLLKPYTFFRNPEENDVPATTNGLRGPMFYWWEQTFHKFEGDGHSVIVS
jgi:hypothetical protein